MNPNDPRALAPEALEAVIDNPAFAEAVDRQVAEAAELLKAQPVFEKIPDLFDDDRVIIPTPAEPVNEPILVPVDLQALYVPKDGRVKVNSVTIPFAIAGATDDATPFGPEREREPGIYLHWALPDSLLRGELATTDDSGDSTLELQPLPDRWLVTRLVAPGNGTRVSTKQWLIFAETAEVIEIGADKLTPTEAVKLTSAQLDAGAAGSLNWLNSFDATAGRFALHDPLEDLPAEPFDNSASYVVAGWWSTTGSDPLSNALSFTVHRSLAELGWTLEADSDSTQSSGFASSNLQSSPAPLDPAAAVVRAVDNPAVDLIGPPGSIIASISYSTTLHGVIHGVPVSGLVPRDLRPNASDVELAIGTHADAVVAALASAANDIDEKDRAAQERVMHAFTADLIARLNEADGAVDIDQSQHRLGFGTLASPDSVTDVYRVGGESGPLVAGRGARGLQSRVAPPLEPIKTVEPATTSLAKDTFSLSLDSKALDARPTVDVLADAALADIPASRQVERPGARLHVPLEPTVAIRGAERSLRYGSDGASNGGVLLCRTTDQLPAEITGVVKGDALLPPLPPDVPREIQALLREAVLLSPRLAPWVASRAAAQPGQVFDVVDVERLLFAETALLFGTDGTYDGRTTAFTSKTAPAGEIAAAGTLLSAQLAQFSSIPGVRPAPEGLTVWGGQPWLPVWLEWEVELNNTASVKGWSLDQIDLTTERPDGVSRRLAGRATLTSGVARSLEGAIAGWLDAESARDGVGLASASTEATLKDLLQQVTGLDALSASLSDLHEQLLGLEPDHGVGGAEPEQIDKPMPLLAGEINLVTARLVDTFGRTLDLPVSEAAVTALDNPGNVDGQLRVAPRILVPSRLRFTAVDPATPRVSDAKPAVVNQVDVTAEVSPVAGFLLPDHIDEALELFDADGNPLGQLAHDPFGGAVTWQIAPGRPIAVDARPDEGLAPAQARLGMFANGMIASDVAERAAVSPAAPDQESALSATLRAIDTTLWTVDSFAGIGSEHIAGLVGRPIAVVRARVELDIDAAGFDRSAIEESIAEHRFPVRLGELTRADDGLLGYFVGTDFSQLRLVDKTVQSVARESGSNRGYFRQLGTAAGIPQTSPLDHRYVTAALDEQLTIGLGEVLDLTLLMLPTSRVHLTSGVLPRKYLALHRDWVHTGLRRMAPSIRVGPVLVDPSQVRLPLISTLREDQRWYRRDSSTTWRDDAILAATQTALLPELPKRIEEGYVRVLPRDEV